MKKEIKEEYQECKDPITGGKWIFPKWLIPQLECEENPIDFKLLLNLFHVRCYSKEITKDGIFKGIINGNDLEIKVDYNESKNIFKIIDFKVLN